MENYQLLIRGYNHDRLGIGNVLKCLITALSINNDSKIQCVPDYIYGAYDTILDKEFVVDKDYHKHPTKEVVPIYTSRLNLLYYEDEYQEDLPNEETYICPIHPTLFQWYFSKKKRIDWHYDTLRIHPRVRARILESMDKIRWKSIVLETTETWYHAFATRVSLGISVRTWNAPHEKNIQRAYSAQVYYDAIAKVIKEHPEIQTFVISLDQPSPLTEYITHLSTTYPTRSIVILSALPHLNPIQYAVTKAFTLARCHYVIGNRLSTFMELVFWFGRCQPVIYPLF